jgi:uncharacterized protein
MSAVRRHPLVAFFVLTYALTWGFLPLGIFGTTGPLVAAVIILAITEGRMGLRDLGSRMIRWRVGWIWYALAIGLPLTVHLLTVGLNVALGAGAPSLAQFSPLSGIILVFVVRLIDPLDGPMGEEPGWRGFAQPRLQANRSPLLATLILALLVASWHLPLWVLPQFGLSSVDILSDFLATVAVTYWYVWLFNHTGGSVLMTLVAHATEGSIQTEQLWTAGAAAGRMSLLYAFVWCVVGMSLVIFDWRFWRAPAPEPATVQTTYEGDPRVR